MLSSYISLEQREMDKNVDRIRDAIIGEARDLHANSHDWANWDDCYQFVQDRNQEFIKENLDNVTLKLDAMLFLNHRGETVYARPIERTPGVRVPDTEVIRRVLQFDSFGPGWNQRRELSGLAVIEGSLSLVSARPVVNSQGDEPPMGWIVPIDRPTISSSA